MNPDRKVVITLSLPVGLLAEFDRAARRERRSRSGQMRLLMEKYLERLLKASEASDNGAEDETGAGA